LGKINGLPETGIYPMRFKIQFVLLVISSLALPALSRHENPALAIQAGDDALAAGNYAMALSQYSRAIRSDKSNPLGYQKRAFVEMQQHKYQDVIRDASKVLKSMPTDSQSLSLRAYAYDSRSQYKKEMKDVEALLNLDHSGRNLLWHARLSERFSAPKQVIDDCNQAINLGLGRDELSQLYKLRASAYKKLGKKNESERELAKYESLGPLAP
jgi:tetratricopeptide (TPR) repeat protein